MIPTCSRRVREPQRRGECLQIRRVITFVPVTALCEHARRRFNEEPICTQPMAFKATINTICQIGSGLGRGNPGHPVDGVRTKKFNGRDAEGETVAVAIPPPISWYNSPRNNDRVSACPIQNGPSSARRSQHSMLAESRALT